MNLKPVDMEDGWSALVIDVEPGELDGTETAFGGFGEGVSVLLLVRANGTALGFVHDGMVAKDGTPVADPWEWAEAGEFDPTAEAIPLPEYVLG